MNIFEVRPASSMLAIFAHPDDAEAAAGGTLSLYAQQGTKVRLITIAKGEKGRGDSTDRTNESKMAAEILGIDSIESLGYNDGEFDNDLELRKLLTEKIRMAKPDIVICPDPTAIFFSHAYVNHRDHRQTGWAVIDVVSSAVGNEKYFSSSPAHNVSHLLCAGSLEPNCVVDISDSIQAKVSSVQCYKSQIGEREQAVSKSLEEAAKSIGQQVGVDFGEAYRYCALQGVPEQI